MPRMTGDELTGPRCCSTGYDSPSGNSNTDCLCLLRLCRRNQDVLEREEMISRLERVIASIKAENARLRDSLQKRDRELEAQAERIEQMEAQSQTQLQTIEGLREDFERHKRRSVSHIHSPKHDPPALEPALPLLQVRHQVELNKLQREVKLLQTHLRHAHQDRDLWLERNRIKVQRMMLWRNRHRENCRLTDEELEAWELEVIVRPVPEPAESHENDGGGDET